MNKSKISLLVSLCCFLLLGTSLLQAQEEVMGRWVTIDDDGVTKKSVVEIYKKDGKIYGKIVHLFDPSTPNPLCTKCFDDRKDQLIIGMDVIRGVEIKGEGDYGDGKILDPAKGKEYGCSMWEEDGKLKVRGWLSFVYRTQTWIRE